FSNLFPTRESNVFCVPLYANREIKNKLRNMFVAIKLNKLDSTVLNQSLHGLHRYSALNLKALSKYGTLEFRHCYGTARADILKNWINLIMGIVKAKKMQPEYLINL